MRSTAIVIDTIRNAARCNRCAWRSASFWEAYMKLVRVGLLCVVLSGWGCGGDDDSGAASSCSVHPDDAGGGAVIECDDGTRTTVAPMPGSVSCSVKQGSGGTKTITCSDGTKVEVHDGTNGKNGTNG